MLRTRVIPILLLCDSSLVKTIKFNDFTYIGDPANTVRIFNELEVDELIFLDIKASKENKKPNLKVLREIADECFMPLAYGGGICSLDDAKEVFEIGFEKVSLNSHAINNPSLITDLANHYGSQSVVVSIDVKSNIFGQSTVRSMSGKFNTKNDPIKWAIEVERLGAGEILLTSIDREGTWKGYDLDLVREITKAVSIPVIANGGCGTIKDLGDVIKKSNASAAALGSMVVFQKKGMGVLINFPSLNKLEDVLL